MISRAIMIRSGVGVLALGAGAFGYTHFYSAPRDELRAQIDSARGNITALEKQLEDHDAVTRRLKDVGRTLLGRKEDQVTDRFRNGLSKIAEECGLVAIKADSGAPKPHTNPLAAVTKTAPALKKAMKKSPDFSVMTGSVEGVGTLDQVLRTLSVVQAQAWVHRVDEFSISLAGRDREHFKLRLAVATLMAPDLAPSAEPEIAQAVPPVGAEAIWRAIAARNPFKEPPQPVVAQVASEAPPQPPPVAPVLPNPYADWKLSAIVSGAHGIEAWMVNPVTKQSKVLAVGGRLQDATFVEGSGERAVFELGGQKYELLNGEPFSSRRPVR